MGRLPEKDHKVRHLRSRRPFRRSQGPILMPPTVAQLRRDIDSGLGGDKIEMSDPSAAPLGTDDEAAGHPASGERVGIAQLMRSGAGGG